MEEWLLRVQEPKSLVSTLINPIFTYFIDFKNNFGDLDMTWDQFFTISLQSAL
jgi:hypothetical protein